MSLIQGTTDEEQVINTTDTSSILNTNISGITIQIQNVVATSDFGSKINLETIPKKVRNAEYNPKRFGAVIMRIRDPKSTALIFSSGKVVCAGTKTIDDANKALLKYRKIINKCVKLHNTGNTKINTTIHNIVGVADCRFPIKLEGLSIDNIESCTYEPELFSGLVYRLANPKVVALVFVSGKVVITGAKTTEDLKKAFNSLFPLLKAHQKL
ncbi:hypothetical protein WA158_003572 [Blastocystis sp. Blastoise]